VVWVYQSEIFPLRLRAKGTSISTVSNWVWNAVIAKIAPKLFPQKSDFVMHLVFFILFFIYPFPRNSMEIKHNASFAYFSVKRLEAKQDNFWLKFLFGNQARFSVKSHYNNNPLLAVVRYASLCLRETQGQTNPGPKHAKLLRKDPP
jgi:hypothetical protein